MICGICGANNPDENSYCNDCGAKLITPPVSYQEQLQQRLRAGFNQGQENQQTYNIQNQSTMQYTQPVRQQQMVQQSPQYHRPVQQLNVQPQMAQMSFPQQNIGQPNISKKKGKAAGIIAVIIILLLIAGALLFFLPLLINGRLSGRYYSKDSDAYIMFDDGVYAVYSNNGGLEFGTYELDGEKIIFTDLNGSKDYGTFNKRKNTVEYGYNFKSDNKKAGFDTDIDKEYLNSLKFKIEDAAEEALEEEAAYNDARSWNSDYYISGDMLETSDMEYIITFADCLGYSSDDVLSYLLKENYISFDLELNIEKNVANVEFY
ncbi:MAG: hypothetical protein IJV15_07015 [Lachnospiraceae bacterium]|nr:hypothetical protein [Lachnospiraceae bacterium]